MTMYGTIHVSCLSFEEYAPNYAFFSWVNFCHSSHWPFVPWFIFSLINTVSPTVVFRFGWFHFCLIWSIDKYSFLQQVLNGLARYCTALHLFRKYTSFLWNVPGGGTMKREHSKGRLFGVGGSKSSTLSLSVVGHEFMMYSTIVPFSLWYTNCKRFKIIRAAPINSSRSLISIRFSLYCSTSLSSCFDKPQAGTQLYFSTIMGI